MVNFEYKLGLKYHTISGIHSRNGVNETVKLKPGPTKIEVHQKFPNPAPTHPRSLGGILW